jgi:prevent-host-death family protein
MRKLSKSRFKAKALEHLREVERTGSELIITDRGRPVVRVIPYHEDPAAALRSLRGSVRKYIDPLAPAVPVGDWKAHR